MTDPTSDERFVASARETLERGAAELAPATLARLRQARLQALEARPRRRPWLVWAGGLATAAAAILVVALWWPTGHSPRHHEAFLDEVELLTAGESLDVYDDLEFYRWLADADHSS